MVVEVVVVVDTTDVDDVGPLGDDAVGRGLGGLVGERRAPVVERVGGAVDDRHDQGPITGHRPSAERRVHPTMVPGHAEIDETV